MCIRDSFYSLTVIFPLASLRILSFCSFRFPKPPSTSLISVFCCYCVLPADLLAVYLEFFSFSISAWLSFCSCYTVQSLLCLVFVEFFSVLCSFCLLHDHIYHFFYMTPQLLYVLVSVLDICKFSFSDIIVL